METGPSSGLPLVLLPLVEAVRDLLEKPAPVWISDRPRPEDIETMKKQALEDSQFDPLKLRAGLWAALVAGEAEIHCQSCTYAKLLWISPKAAPEEPPLADWGRFFQWLGPPAAASASGQAQKWRIFWFPAATPRRLPLRGKPVGPEHVNGGYSLVCRPDQIVIYRKEEATRVLVHELLHAACLDPPTTVIPFREANVEAWAELFLVAYCSKGSFRRAASLWRRQAQWIANQNYLLSQRYNIRTPTDYAWRYTLGRAPVLENLGIQLPAGHLTHSHSSRLTHPDLCV